MKYKFTKTKDPDNKFDVSNITVEFDAVDLGIILEEFSSFLKGCGFIFDGELSISDPCDASSSREVPFDPKRGDHLVVDLVALNDKNSDIPASSFRKTCLNKGYYLTGLYPVYHQAWELDEWGAIGLKSGIKYRLETNHGWLEPIKL